MTRRRPMDDPYWAERGSIFSGARAAIFSGTGIETYGLLVYNRAMIKNNAIVLYKGQCAIVTGQEGGKYIIEYTATDGKKGRPCTSVQKVREKDIVLLHSGPAPKMEAAASFNADEVAEQIEEARQLILADDTAGSMDFAEIASIMRGSFLASEAWGLYSALINSKGFVLDENALKDGAVRFTARSDEEIAAIESKAHQKEQEEAERAAFIARLRKRELLKEDARFMSDVEAVALGQTDKSRAMSEANMIATPESAHRLLLDTGIWSITRNPYPTRFGLFTASASGKLPPMPDEERVAVDSEAYAIDNAWSADPDDAVAWDGKYLWVHVADPAAAVLPDSDIDKAARKRGTTLYLPEGTSRMLSETCLADYALGLNEISHALSFRIKLTEDATKEANGENAAGEGEQASAARGEDKENAIGAGDKPSHAGREGEDAGKSLVEECEVIKTTVKVKRMTYAQATEQKDSKQLKPLFDIARRNFARRKARGARSVNLSEVHITVDNKDGQCNVAISEEEHYEAADMVAEMMLLAGEAVAHYAFAHNIPFLYVSQEPPDIPVDIPDGLAGQFRILRSMRRRSVGVTPAPHSAIGVAMYTQVTSPLRRYGDLIAHEQLRAYLDKRPMIDTDEMLLRISAGDASSMAGRKASRMSEMHWKLVYLLQHKDWTAQAVCVDIVNNLVKIYIPSLDMQSMMAIGHRIRFNDEITVRAANIDIPTQKVDFIECKG